MPASLRLLAGLVALSLVAAVLSIGGIYREGQARSRTLSQTMTAGHVTAGHDAIGRYGCGACHVIPGVAGAGGAVGPALGGVAVRATIAGRLPNEPDAMIRWLRHPQAVVPGNAMPEQGVTDRDARDMAAYLYTLRH